MTMLDRIANAVSELEREKGDAFDIGDVMARKIARAALMAMREPGSAAVSAMFDRLDCGQLGEDFDTTDVWQAGIDAILADTPPCPSAPGSVE